MKTPDEIKKGLALCSDICKSNNGCPYAIHGLDCTEELMEDALAYIQRLERERDAAVDDLKYANVRGDCWHCKHENNPEHDADCYKYDCDCETCRRPCPCASCRDGSAWQWRGVEEDKHGEEI